MKLLDHNLRHLDFVINKAECKMKYLLGSFFEEKGHTGQLFYLGKKIYKGKGKGTKVQS